MPIDPLFSPNAVYQSQFYLQLSRLLAADPNFESFKGFIFCI